MSVKDLWVDVIANAAEECGAKLTREQEEYIADAAQGMHDNYDLVEYNPGWAGRFAVLQDETEEQHEREIHEMDQVIRRAYKLYDDDRYEIDYDGYIRRI